jgi:hypothetical protein
MVPIKLTTKEKISILNQVVRIVEKNGITCLDAFISAKGKMKSYSEDTWLAIIRIRFPEVKGEDTIIRKYGWIEQCAWLKSKKGKRQRVKLLKDIREIYIQKYFEETKNKPGKNKIPASMIPEHSTFAADKK